jgi:hypothetical protein
VFFAGEKEGGIRGDVERSFLEAIKLAIHADFLSFRVLYQ